MSDYIKIQIRIRDKVVDMTTHEAREMLAELQSLLGESDVKTRTPESVPLRYPPYIPNTGWWGIIPPYIATSDTNRVNLSALCGDVAREDISTGYFPSQELLGKTQSERSGY